MNPETISKVFEMFVLKDEYPKDRKQPFKQDGYYCATDAHSLIRLPENLVDLPYKEQDRPIIGNVIPTHLHAPIEIEVKKLNSEIKRLTPMVDEKKDCVECEDGQVQCDLGHWHDCDICYGEANKTGNKIPDKATALFLHGSVFAYPQLKRLVEASKLMEVKNIYKVFGEGNKPSLFEVGKAAILVAPVMGGKVAKKIEL